jgi:hypothetical protein
VIVRFFLVFLLALLGCRASSPVVDETETVVRATAKRQGSAITLALSVGPRSLPMDEISI